MVRIHVKERAEAMSTEMGDEQQAAIRTLANELHRLNAAVVVCVESGLSVELHRTARHHAQDGFRATCWRRSWSSRSKRRPHRIFRKRW